MSTERMFVAIPIEDRLRSRLQELQEISLETLSQYGVTHVRAEHLRNSHITVHFLGDVGNAEALIEMIDGRTLSSAAFSFTINEIGVFDAPRKARVLWAGVDQHQSFRMLRNEVDALLEPYGFAEERKEYTPHLTLARFRDAQDIRKCFEELRQLTDVCSIEQYAVREVVLYSSKLSPQGATHTKRALLKLS
jgi:RNA 2',3'-cyclic 3'-phosphodiesterase